MSKKMKVWAAVVLGVMMAGVVSVNVYALDDKDVVGTWYANSLTIDGLNVFHPGAIMMEMTMEIREDGKGEVTTTSEESEPDVDEFEWKIDGDNIVITSDDEVLEGVYSDGSISINLDGMTMTLGQEKEEYVPYEPGKVLEDTKLEDFDGEWNSSLMSAFGMQVPTGTLFDIQLNLSISGGKATLVTIENGTETTAELEGEMDKNVLVLKSTEENTEEKTEDDAEDYSMFSTETMRLYLQDDGKLCFTTADSLEEADAEDSEEDSEESVDWTIKVFFDKLEVE
ncbi:lipocalin family protein [Blautia sp. HCP28S3_G10]|uniref:lipocalin family protein n=1 Tax=Blautia sp. HCP28S3_G10 TaxID=3438908 RepID=UPI003F88AAF5